MKKFLLSLFLVFFMIGISNATLIGDYVDMGHYAPDQTTIEFNGGNVKIGPGNEFQVLEYYFVDISESALRVEFLNDIDVDGNASFNGFQVFDLDDSSNNPLQGVNITTNVAGWESYLSYTGDSISIDMLGLSFVDGDYMQAELNFAGASVPEPATLLLFGIGLIGLSGFSRKNKQLKFRS